MINDVRIGSEVNVMDRPCRPSLTQRLSDNSGADPAIAVPLGSAVPQSHTMHHALTQEPSADPLRIAKQVKTAKHGMRWTLTLLGLLVD
jgi:hypothetical protein